VEAFKPRDDLLNPDGSARKKQVSFSEKVFLEKGELSRKRYILHIDKVDAEHKSKESGAPYVT